MPKRTSKAKTPKRPKDINQLAHELVRQSTEKPEIVSSEAVKEFMRQMGSKGGKIGGKRRLETMTGEQRREIASRAAKAMWTKKAAQKISGD